MQAIRVMDKRARLVRHPYEDHFLFDEYNKTISVADGVTRDPFVRLPDKRKILGKLLFTLFYPRNTPAHTASRLFCEKSIEIMGNNGEPGELINSAFIESNNEIANLNKRLGLGDYILKDFASCVGANAMISEGYLHWGYIADCGLAVFDETGEIRFKTPDDGPTIHHKYFWEDLRLKGIDWRNPISRYIIRSEYRNNPCEEHSYGVLSGEKSALDYVRQGVLELKPNDSIVLYTDGLEHLLKKGEFRSAIREKDFTKMKRLARKFVKNEGTLVYTPI